MPAHLTAAENEAMGDPVLYQIRVSGRLGHVLLAAFPAFTAQQQGAETLLTGLLPDAAALYAVLEQVEALGLDLIEVRRVQGGDHQYPVVPWSADQGRRITGYR